MAFKKYKLLGFFGLVTCAFSMLLSVVGCNNEPKVNNEDVITKILDESEPMAEVHVGEFGKISGLEVGEVEETGRYYGSSTILDMPRDQAINIVYDNYQDRSLQSVSSFLNTLVDANDDVRIVSTRDRGGNYKNNLLSSDGTKLTVSSPGGFQYGEVYEISINNAPYLSFEGKDPQIRKLTVEIEDDPSEAATYDIKNKKSGIVNIDRNKITNRKQVKGEQIYTFDYEGTFPQMNKGTIFYATVQGNEDFRLDFYGTYESKKSKNGFETVTYSATNLDDVYEDFHMKGNEELDLDDAEILLTSEFAVQQFKNSSVARGLVKSLMDFTPDDLRKIIDIIRHVSFDIYINVIGDTVETKQILKLGSYMVKPNHYIGIEIGHQSITDYTFDFDVKLSYSWIFPTGVDYKVKCIEDTQDIWYFKFGYDHQPIPDVEEADVDYADKLLDDIIDAMDGKSSKSGELIDKETSGPQASGTKTIYPLVCFNINYFTPLQIKFKIDFYFDLSLKVNGLVKYESHAAKIDFNFSNMDGGGQDTSQEIKKTSNLVVFVSGGLYIEMGLRLSLGISILGLYDYLHIEGYAEAYMNFTFNGMIGMNIDFTASEFSGYYSVNLALTCGIRAGLNIKLVVTSFNLGYTWMWDLYRMKFDSPLEHWVETAPTTIEMTKETLSLDETGVLWIKYFDPIAFSIKEKQYKADNKFSILSGILVRPDLIEVSSGHTFEYTPEEPNKIEISEDGLIHVKDGTESSFTTRFKIHVSKAAGFISDRIITINYEASDIKDVYAGDTLIGQYRPQYTFKLPEPEKIRGKEFEYYLYEGQKYYVGDSFTMPDHSISLETHYRNLPIYRVYFYDGFNILIAIDEIYEGEDAHEPDPLIRDRYMDPGWEFFYWSRSFKNVHQEIHVTGVYVKVG